MKPKLVAKNLSAVTYGGKQLFGDLSFEVDSGELVLITGPNGAGKSTLMRILAGEIRPQNGSLRMGFDHIRYLPQLQNQTFHLPLTLGDVAAFDQTRTGFSDTIQSFLSREELKLSWNSASGGERQKALLTKHLNSDWDLLLLDEPLNHLDAATKQKLLAMLAVSTRAHGKTVIMVCHEPSSLEVPIHASQTILIGARTKDD